MILKRNSSHHNFSSQQFAENQQGNYVAGLDQGFGIEPDPNTQMANADLFGSMAQERDAEIALNQHFCADDSKDNTDFIGQFGLGSAQDDTFNLSAPHLSAQETSPFYQQDLHSQVLQENTGDSTSFAQAEFDNAAPSSQHYQEGFEDSGAMSLASSADLNIKQVSIEQSSYSEDNFVPSDEHEAAAKLIAEMMLGRDPLANITAELNGDDQFVGIDSGDNPVDLREIGGESTAQEVASAQEVALDLIEDAPDELLVNKTLKEPKHKIELVDEESLPSLTLLEVEKDHESSLSELRKDALVQAFVGDLSHATGPTEPSFTLLRQQFSLLDSEDGDGEELEQDLLSEEEQEQGDQADINEFITGNISTLRTGTDSITVSFGNGKFAANEDVSPDQPSVKVETIPYEPATGAEVQVHYTSTLSTTRFNVEHPKLLPTLFKDIVRYFYVYFLAAMLGVLCLVKVYQVQDTRDLTSRLNEVAFNNEELEKEWLNLLATRQNLSEHAKIRSYATRQLNMVSPRTENEHVISLH